MKKIISIIATLSLVTTVFASFAHAEADVTFKLAGVKSSYEVGKTASVKMTITAPNGFAAFKTTLSYDTDTFEYVLSTMSTDLYGTFVTDTSSAGKVVSAFGTDEDLMPTKWVYDEETEGYVETACEYYLIYRFKVKDDVYNGDYNFTIECDPNDLRNATNQVITGDTTGATATITVTGGKIICADFTALNEAIKTYDGIQAKADEYWGREWTWAEAATAYDAAKAINQETETDQAKVDTAAKALSDAVGKFVIRPLTTVYASDIDIITKTDNLSGFKSYGITAQFDILPKEEVKRIVYDLRDGDTVSKCTFDVSAFANGEYLVNSIIGFSIIGCPMDSDLIVENVYMDSCAGECRNFNSYPVDFETSGILITLDEDNPIKKILGNHATIGIGIEVKPFTEYVFNSAPTYNYIEYTLSNGTKTKGFRWDIGTSINSEATFGLNITNCPLDVKIEVVNVEAKDEPPTYVDSIYDYDSNPSRPDLCYGTQYKNIFDPQLAILDTDILTNKTYDEIFN